MKLQKPKYECPNCHQIDCFEHCNFCGLDIKWTNYLGDPYYETNKKGKRVRYAFEKNDTVHRCMKKGQGTFVNKTEINEYVLDEYRTIRRYSGPRFKCDFCGRFEDLPVMLTHHIDPRFDCEDKLMKQFFKQKSERLLDPSTHRLDEW